MENTESFFSPLVASFLIGIPTLYILYWFFTRKNSYWAERGIPFAKPLPLFGNILDALKKPLQDIELERYRKYGPLYGHFEGSRPLLSVGDPELLRLILIKDFPSFTSRRVFDTSNEIFDKMLSIVRGEDWKRIRTIVTPTFTTGKIKRMLSIFKDCSKTLVNNFRVSAEKGEPIEVKSVYGAFTMDIIASSAFSTKIDSHNDPNNPFVKTARKAFSANINWRFVMFTVFPGLVKLLKIDVFNTAAMKFFVDVTHQIVEERKRTGQKRNDFLQLLIDAAEDAIKEGKLDLPEQEEEDIAKNYGEIDSDQIIKSTNSKKKLSFVEMVAQCVIFFLAGYETSASTLAFATYCLALNPDIQEKLIEEVDEALKANNGELTYEAIQAMKCLDNVISETLRLNPPLLRLERFADADYKLGDTGITIPKGMIITIPTYAMHRDPKLYPDPEKFDPERFDPDERAKRNPFTYLPFGAGPRNCVAMRFALMEVKVCLADVISNFRIKRCSETKVPLEYNQGQGFLQPKAITLQLEIRKEAVKPSI